MNYIERTVQKPILSDLSEKMVFLSGPRQTGKTTLARKILENSENGGYYNWDNNPDRRSILEGNWPAGKALVVLDEIHKYGKWKTLIKGAYDTYHERLSFLVTGSARLNIYRKGGDSLQGRYHHHRLHPFSLAELETKTILPKPFSKIELVNQKRNASAFNEMLAYSGFPEPFLRGTEKAYRRWRKERMERVLLEDVRDMNNIRDISNITLLSDILPGRVGSLLSVNNIREELEVSHRAVSNWLLMLENLYYCYRIPPYARNLVRALKKDTKLFLYDWAAIADEGAKLENLTASHLLKLCHALEDREGYKAALWYLRDLEKREVDFLVTVDNKPWFAVEVKSSRNYKNHLSYFGKRQHIPFLYMISNDNTPASEKDGIVYCSVERFLLSLGV